MYKNSWSDFYAEKQLVWFLCIKTIGLIFMYKNNWSDFYV